MARIYDISQTLQGSLPVWPGDTPFELVRQWAIGRDSPVNVSRITLSSHSGSHADAPLHYDRAGAATDETDVGRYLGPCVLIDARHAQGLILPTDIEADLPGSATRVLFRTYESFPKNEWDSGFTAVSPETIHLLADRGAVLIGIDGPSLDPETSKTMDAHMAVCERGLSILEGLVLDDVPPGEYELIAVPLKIAGGDASPVRALLREI